MRAHRIPSQARRRSRATTKLITFQRSIRAERYLRLLDQRSFRQVTCRVSVNSKAKTSTKTLTWRRACCRNSGASAASSQTAKTRSWNSICRIATCISFLWTSSAAATRWQTACPRRCNKSIIRRSTIITQHLSEMKTIQQFKWTSRAIMSIPWTMAMRR